MSKRAPGEGSVRQRPNGLWEARLNFVDPVTGRRRSASFYGQSAEAARAELDAARERVRTQAPVLDSSMRLADWIERWSVQRSADRAGIADVTVHTLRHSAAVAWLEQGVHIKAVAELLGHSSIAITGDIYGHASDAATRSAVDGLSDALGL